VTDVIVTVSSFFRGLYTHDSRSACGPAAHTPFINKPKDELVCRQTRTANRTTSELTLQLILSSGLKAFKRSSLAES